MSNHFITKENTKREQQRFFINTQEIFGIQDINISYEQNLRPLKVLGMGEPVMVPDGIARTNCIINSLVIGSDKFIALTGTTGFNGYLIKSRDQYTDNFSFVSGYLTSYASRASIGEIPAVSVNIAAFGNVGPFDLSESPIVSGHFTTISGGNSSFLSTIADPGSITLNLDDFTTNRVLSYDLNVNVSRNAIYPLNTRVPTKVETNYPIEISLEFQFIKNDYTIQKLHSSPLQPKVRNISLILRDSNDSIITNYNLQNLFLVQEQQSVGTEGPVVINALYRGYYSAGDAGL